MDNILISGREYAIMRIATGNRNATARLKGNTIVLSLPSGWPAAERERVGGSLLRRAVRAIEKGKWNPGRGGRAMFFHGQRLRALGREYDIAIRRGSRFGARAAGGRIEIRAAEHPEAEKKVAGLVRREIIRDLMPALVQRVNAINGRHFKAEVSRITVRDNVSRWGSCGPDGSISLNFRLLFMPEEVLDYVIVHELAHTKYRSHGPRFWALVGKALPDYGERRKWLKENGPSVLSGAGEETRQPAQECFEEPY